MDITESLVTIEGKFMLRNQFWARFALATFIVTFWFANLCPAQAKASQTVQVRCLANYSGCSVAVDNIPHSRFYFLNPLTLYSQDDTGPGFSANSAYIDYPEHTDLPVFFVHSEYPQWSFENKITLVPPENGNRKLPEETYSTYFLFAHMDEKRTLLPFASCNSTYEFRGNEQHDSHIVSVLGDSATQEPVIVDVETSPYKQPIAFKTLVNVNSITRAIIPLTDVHVASYSSEALDLSFDYPQGFGFTVEVLSALAVVSAAR